MPLTRRRRVATAIAAVVLVTILALLLAGSVATALDDRIVVCALDVTPRDCHEETLGATGTDASTNPDSMAILVDRLPREPVVLFVVFLLLNVAWQTRRVTIGVLSRSRLTRGCRLALVWVATATGAGAAWITRLTWAGRLALAGVTTALVIAAALVVMPPQLEGPPHVSWSLEGYNGVAPAQADQIDVKVGLPTGCGTHQFPRDSSWLAEPAVAYADTSVTITLSVNATFAEYVVCGPPERRTVGHVLDVYVYLPVHLREPLGNRQLFDGASQGTPRS